MYDILSWKMYETRSVISSFSVLYLQEDPKWYKQAIDEHGSVEVNIICCFLTGGSRVGKTSLKHYLLHNTAREDKTSTGVLEAPEVATIVQGIAIGSSWEVLDDDKLGELISQIDMEKTKTFPSNTPHITEYSPRQATAAGNTGV